ncbi:hypothetical protein FB451DRAFT_1556363 [Mycena latifolia]|nr:hypothetical protein FB451DRAFT_1556363 [Mycena latifolia]
MRMNVALRIALLLLVLAGPPSSSPLVDPLSSAAAPQASSPPSSAPPAAPASSIVLPAGPVALGAEVALPDTIYPPGIIIATAPNEPDFGEDGLVKTLEARYTLAMLDPDAPSAPQPTSSQFRHWVITGQTLPKSPTQPALQPTPAANAYRPPGPPKGSGVSDTVRIQFPSQNMTSHAPNVRPLPRAARPADAPERGGSTETRRRWDGAMFGERHELEMGGAAVYLVRGEECESEAGIGM